MYKNIEQYYLPEVISFYDPRGEWGAFSNLHLDFPIQFVGHTWPSVENLYFALSFQHHTIFEQFLAVSPQAAKALKKRYEAERQPEWSKIKISQMKRCLQLKFDQHRSQVEPLLRVTNRKHLVELSPDDTFWGACQINSQQAIGCNVIGKIWMEIRESLDAN
ncbi:MAG TPA: NADAR family protein [Vitreimonas sp.]|nr:NADAR family protein [Vitreimonas sp.]